MRFYAEEEEETGREEGKSPIVVCRVEGSFSLQIDKARWCTKSSAF